MSNDFVLWSARLVIDKDPDAIETWKINGDRILAAGAAFASPEFEVVSSLDEDLTPLEIDEDDVELTDAGRKVRFTMTGGTAGASYVVRFRFATNEAPPQADDYSFTVTVAEQ